jgi:hypothetical protein
MYRALGAQGVEALMNGDEQGMLRAVGAGAEGMRLPAASASSPARGWWNWAGWMSQRDAAARSSRGRSETLAGGAAMITFYHSTDHGVEILPQAEPGCWVNVVAPSAEEVAELQAVLRVPQDFITYPLDVGEMARTERENGATLLILRVPFYQGQTSDIPYTTVPIGIILTEDSIATVCRTETDVIQALVAGRARGMHTARRNRLTLQLFLLTASQFLANLREINKSVDRLRTSCSFRCATGGAELLAPEEPDLFATGLASNELMLQHLQKSHYLINAWKTRIC